MRDGGVALPAVTGYRISLRTRASATDYRLRLRDTHTHTRSGIKTRHRAQNDMAPLFIHANCLTSYVNDYTGDEFELRAVRDDLVSRSK